MILVRPPTYNWGEPSTWPERWKLSPLYEQGSSEVGALHSRITGVQLSEEEVLKRSTQVDSPGLVDSKLLGIAG